MTPEDWQEFMEFKAWKDSRAGIAPPAVEKGPTISDLQKPYELVHKPRPGVAPTASTIKSWHSCQRIHWNHILPFWGALTVKECTWDKADEYHRLRQTQPRMAPGSEGPVATKYMTSNATINLEMNTLRAMLNWHVSRHKVDSNPLSGHPELPTSDDPRHDRKFPIPYEHFCLIVKELPPLTRLMMILGYETGMRRDEFRLLEWSEVDLSKEVKTIFLSKYRTKAKKERTIVLSDLAVSVIQSAPRYIASKYVFWNPLKTDGSAVSRGTIGSQWRAAREAAGVRGPRGQHYWIHSIRKSYGANKAMQGMPIYMLMEQMGHSDKNVHDEYTKMSPGHLGAVVEHQNKPAPRMGPRSVTSSPVESTDPLSKLMK